jgi:isoleucyl-tRNA synthetase
LQYEKIFGNGARGHVIAANFVTNDSGTGLVHTAPSHGFEDYEACRDKEFPIISLGKKVFLFVRLVFTNKQWMSTADTWMMSVLNSLALIF